MTELKGSCIIGVCKSKGGEDMSINKVRGYRNMLGLTQEQLGAKLKMTKQSYCNKENGRSRFSDTEKLAFKNLLLPVFPNISIEDIFF